MPRSPKSRCFIACIVAALAGPSAALADKWESPVNGEQAYIEVKNILSYKQAQAEQVESLFYGLRDKLYVVSPKSNAGYSNNYLTPNSVTYTVQVQASYDTTAVSSLYSALKRAQPRYFARGGNLVIIKFPQGTVKLRIYDEIMPTYMRLVRGGYAFEARAVLLDNEQTVIASSDTSLLLSTPQSGNVLDFSKRPLLRSYQQAEAPDLGNLFSAQSDGARNAEEERLRKFLEQPAYRLTNATEATFYSLPLEELKKVVSCRVLRDSDELLVYKKDAK